MSMAWVAVIGTVASVGTGIYASNKASKSAKEQAAGAIDAEARRAAQMQKLFADRDPGAFSMEGLEALAGFELDIDPMDYIKKGGKLSSWAMDFMRDQAEKTFNQTVGKENLPLFETFVTDNLERASYDFSSLPPEIMRRVEGSALSRSLGGPAGMAENLSVENKIRLQQQGENSAFRALGFKQGFMPDTINPISSVFELANFERTNQVQSANVQLGALGALGNLEMQRFGLEAGFQAQPMNTAGIASAGSANTWNAVSQGLGSLTSAAMMYGGRNTQAQSMAGSSNYAAQAPGAVDWRTNATSTYNPSTYNPAAYNSNYQGYL